MTTKELLEGFKKYHKLKPEEKAHARKLVQGRPEARALIEAYDIMERDLYHVKRYQN